MFWQVMELFDPDIPLALMGPEIDRAFNAMTLMQKLHVSFGSLHWYLQETDEVRDQYLLRG